MPDLNERTLARTEQLWLDPDYNPIRTPRTPRCPICHSIDLVGGRCWWCHHDTEEDV